MKKKFKKFLKRHNAWKKWKKNLELEGSLYETFDFEDSPEFNIGGAFLWIGTKEGAKFWKKLNDKWKEIIKNDSK